MKLGFEDRVLNDRHFRNIALNGREVGFHLGVCLNYYRGLPVSCIENLELKVDGREIPPHLICVVINEKKFALDQLSGLHAEFWGIRKRIELEVYNGGLEPGEHEVALTLHLRNPYMRFAPRVYGAIDGSASKKMVLGAEAVAL
jgi:hypothetical protein